MGKSPTSVDSIAVSLSTNSIRRQDPNIYSDTETRALSTQVWPVWIYHFAITHENTQWREDAQMQPVWICLLSHRLSEASFEESQWRKANKMQPVWLHNCLVIRYERSHYEASQRGLQCLNQCCKIHKIYGNNREGLNQSDFFRFRVHIFFCLFLID